MRRHLLRGFAAVLLLLIVLVAAAAIWASGAVRASLPQLDGRQTLPGLSAPAEVTRDELGIPTIRAASRADAARATGFLHAQDRFFQMDLARRQSAGELAELAGAVALPLDRERRVHRFRDVARRAVALLDEADRAILDAYAEGVNAGLAALRAAPVEYTLLRQTPRPWSADDSLLVVLSMYITLQDASGEYESTLATMHDVLPEPMFRFLAPLGTDWDAPMGGDTPAVSSVPGPDVYDLRARRRESRDIGRPQPRPAAAVPRPESAIDLWRASPGGTEALAIGSNSWAVAGRLTADGGALLANDMHLVIRVPNIWYRAMLEWPDPSEGRVNRLVGVTLPGLPALVVGSNTHVAWGFTNTYSDWSDIVLLEIDPADGNRYRTPDGWRSFEQHEEVIAVAGEPDWHETVVWTVWGPVLGPDHRGRQRAYRWVAHDAERLAAKLTPLESARTLDEAFADANGVGAPGQNLVVADRDGRIGWTVYGSLPRRVGFDGRLPASWGDGTRGWRGWLDAAEYPRIVDPPDGRVWTANARVVDGEMLARLGDGGYDIGARAHIIRDRLMRRERFTPDDLLAIQLDAGADFLSRWRGLLLDTLTLPATEAHPARARLRDIVQNDWSGEASPDSAAYRLTRMFRDEVSASVIEFVLIECYEADPAFDYRRVRTREAPIWTLITEGPLHLLDPRHETWHDLFLAAVDAVLAQTTQGRADDLADRVWSEYNVAAYRHPLSAQLSFASRWLDMPVAPLPGDVYTPRVHWRAIGASVRMVVSPGREEHGIMQMPTGQSGHPLSPFYANSHPAWMSGTPAPLLPGEAVHRLHLEP